MVVSAIVDTLKTAFPRSEPQSPTEELSEAELIKIIQLVNTGAGVHTQVYLVTELSKRL